MKNKNRLIEQLTDALRAASDHLDFCGYGDVYERECAESAKLPEQIRNALAAADHESGEEE